jgi:predicted membrane GTPase involved in stress response
VAQRLVIFQLPALRFCKSAIYCHTQAGTILMREQGSVVAHETGQVTAYALESAQEKGTLFIRPGDQVSWGWGCCA